MKFKLLLFAGLLVVALIVFGCFAKVIMHVRPAPVEFHKDYAALDFKFHAPTNWVFNPVLSSQGEVISDVISDLLIAADVYLFGDGTELSYTNAVKCFETVLTKDAQNPRALMGMAICYYTGKGVQKNLDKAADLGWGALVSAEERNDDSYESVEKNPFSLLLIELVSSCKNDEFNAVHFHEDYKDHSLSAETSDLSELWKFVFFVFWVAFIWSGCVKPNILIAPWQIKLMKLLESISTAIFAIFIIGSYYYVPLFLVAAMILWCIMRKWKFGFPFCVIGVWCLHLVCLCAKIFPNVAIAWNNNVAIAWNNIPMFCGTCYGNIPLKDCYMSVWFPEVYSEINGAYFYVALLVCAIFIYLLSLVRKEKCEK